MYNKNQFHKCCMPQCRGFHFDLTHKFPKNTARTATWLVALKQPHLKKLPLEKLSKSVFLCGRHFRPQDYVHAEARTLNHNVVPSLNISDLSELHLCKAVHAEVYSGGVSQIVRQQQEPQTSTNEQEPGQQKPINSEAFISELIVEEDERAENDPNNIGNSYAIITLQDNGGDANVQAKKRRCDESTEYLSISYLENGVFGNTIEASAEGVSKEQQSVVEKDITEEVIEIVNPKEKEEIASTSSIPSSLSTVIETFSEFQVKVNGRNIIIVHANLVEPLKLDMLWLRSQCNCTSCFDTSKNTRKYGLFEISSKEIYAKQVTVDQQSQHVEVEWYNGHKSMYSIPKLHGMSTAAVHPAIDHLPIQLPWSVKHTKYRDDFKLMHFNEFICLDTNIHTAFDRLKRSGLLVLENITTNTTQRSLVDELIVRRLFPDLKELFRKETRTDFYKTQKLPHTNCTYDSFDCGLQVLSLSLTKNNPARVFITAMDGFDVAYNLMRTNRPAFDYLCKHKHKQVYRDGPYNRGTNELPVIQMRDKFVERIHFTPYQHDDGEPKDMRNYLDNLKHFAHLMGNTSEQWKFRFSKDMLIILDNWRICWQVGTESAYNPQVNPSMNCIYVERKHYLSRLHSLQLSR